jgi:threonine dehydrogenase-like Zn-dependent dehydrogenase
MRDIFHGYGKPVLASEAAKTGTIIPGHEPAGDVVEIGAGVTNVKPGDRAAVYLAIGCGHCRWCHGGYRMLCPEFKCLGFDVDGGDADEIVNSGNQNATAQLRELTDGVGVDVAIDCSGNGKAQNSALDSARQRKTEKAIFVWD